MAASRAQGDSSQRIAPTAARPPRVPPAPPSRSTDPLPSSPTSAGFTSTRRSASSAPATNAATLSLVASQLCGSGSAARSQRDGASTATRPAASAPAIAPGLLHQRRPVDPLRQQVGVLVHGENRHPVGGVGREPDARGRAPAPASANGPPPGTTTIASRRPIAPTAAHTASSAPGTPSSPPPILMTTRRHAVASGVGQQPGDRRGRRRSGRVADPVGERASLRVPPAGAASAAMKSPSPVTTARAEPRMPCAHPPHARRRPSRPGPPPAPARCVPPPPRPASPRRRRPRGRAARRRTRGSAGGRPEWRRCSRARPARRARGRRRRSGRTPRRRAGRARPRAAPRGPPPRPASAARRCRPARRSAAARDRCGPAAAGSPPTIGMMSVEVVPMSTSRQSGIVPAHEAGGRGPVGGGDLERPLPRVGGVEEASLDAVDPHRLAGKRLGQGVEHEPDALALGPECLGELRRHRHRVSRRLAAEAGREPAQRRDERRRVALHLERRGDALAEATAGRARRRPAPPWCSLRRCPSRAPPRLGLVAGGRRG